MTSLVPFDLRCVGQLTALSLRCAPLHVCLPPSWSSALEVPTLLEDTRQPSTPALASSPLSPCRESSCAPGTIDATRTPTPPAQGGPSSPVRTPPPPSTPEADRTLAAGTHSSPRPNNGTASPSAPMALPVTTATHAPHSSTRVVSLHDPSLSVEAFFELRPVHHDAGEDGEQEGGAGLALTPPHTSREKHNVGSCKAEGGSGLSAVSTPFITPAAVYSSEVVRGSSHPNWSPLPSQTLRPYAGHSTIEISVFYTGTCVQKAWALGRATHNAHASPPPPCDVCVLRCRVDLRRCYYLGATLEEADGTLSRLLRAEEQRAASQPRLPQPVLFLRCFDGVFAPTACFAGWLIPVAATFDEWQTARTRTFCPAPVAADFQSTSPSPSSLNAIAGRSSLAAVAAAQAAAACKEVPWSRTPSSVAWRYPAFAVPRAGQTQHQQLRITAGDVKAATHATLAWQWLVGTLEERKAALTRELDAAASAQPSARALAAQCAAMRVQLSAARESLTFTTLELEEMRERVERRQRRLLREEEALAAVRSYEARLTSPETVTTQREEARAEEAQRAALRAQLARGRQQKVRELCLVYAVTLSSQYASHTCAKVADAKDHINGAALPVMFARRTAADAASHLFASSTEDMHEEAVALGHACHLLLVLSMLYCCPLPYPILLGGCKSHVLASPNIDAVAAYAAPYTATGARKYALSCYRVAERPLMMAGVQLLLYDGAVLAAAMGKPARRVAGCADRLGALLDLLLHDAE